ncbi:putative mitochondrial protein, partial [Mucuna pruriens]
MESLKPISMSVEEKLKLNKESEGKMVDAAQYKSSIGSLRYLTTTRSTIVFGINLLSRFMEEPRVCYLQEVKRILLYIKDILTNIGVFKEITKILEVIHQKKNTPIEIFCDYKSTIILKDKAIILGLNELPNSVDSSRLNDHNYLQWAWYIHTTLKGCKKLSHIEGSDTPRDKDYLIMTWLWNYMTPKISRNYMFYSSICEIWEKLIETY